MTDQSIAIASISADADIGNARAHGGLALPPVLARLRKPKPGVALVLVALAAAGAVAYLLADSGSTEPRAVDSPAPRVLIREPAAPEDTADLGFPAFATKNTTRVAGVDPAADAAAIALAVHPSTGGVRGPDAVTVVDAEDWQAGIAAGSLVAAPIGAPVLVTESNALGELTASALRSLDPRGSAATAGRRLFALGDAAVPEDLEALSLGVADPAALAAAVARLRERLAGKPEHLLLASSEDPAYAMPAASWAARSGDPVLFVERRRVPKPTIRALERHPRTPVYTLGPESVISPTTMSRIERAAPTAVRVGAADPVANAIAFARYAAGSFGWNINDPGHGFVIANASRPLDAGVAAPLSASGTWGPLLLTDEVDEVPAPLRGYLLDLKPGYDTDPTRAVYNHLWLVGDDDAISVDFQARVDELAEVAPVTSGSGAAPQPQADSEPLQDQDQAEPNQ